MRTATVRGLPVELQMRKVGFIQCVFDLGATARCFWAKANRRTLRIAESAFRTLEGLVVADANKVIVRVKTPLPKITGYGADGIGKVSAVFRVHRNKMNPTMHCAASFLPTSGKVSLGSPKEWRNPSGMATCFSGWPIQLARSITT